MKHLANTITISRVILGLLALIFLKSITELQIAALILIPIVMILDMFDGIAARKTKTCSLYGAIYDILADRIIEFSFFSFFASNGICSIWAALIIIWRGLVLDTIRGIALQHGKTAFGKNSLHKTGWANALTNSRFSRGTYNTLKTITFIVMGLQMYQPEYNFFISAFVWITVAWSLLRAVPVIVDGCRLITVASER